VTAVARMHYEIPDDLHRRAKSAAALRGVTLKDFLIEALERATRTAESTRTRKGGR
jgi:predicted HicB family RNase H-like nuclease